MTQPDAELLTREEVAQRMKVAPRTVILMAARGDIPCLKLNPRVMRFHWPDVVAALQKRRVN